MTDTASTALSAETQPIAGAPAPEDLSYEWPERGTHRRAPPPPEMKKFVRSLSVMGVPVHEIARRVKERVGARRYHMRTLYRDFAEDLMPRMKRGPRDKRRVRLIEKPPGWKPIIAGSPFSYADLLAILQSDLDSRDLAILYGVRETVIYSTRRGESKYTKYLLPRMSLGQGVTPKDMAFRAMVTSDLAVSLVQQMRNMVNYAFQMIEEGKYPDPMGGAAAVLQGGRLMYRLSAEDGKVEEKIVFTKLEKKAALLDGWSEERPK